MKKVLRALERQHDYGFLAGFILILFSFEKKKKSTEVSLRIYNPHFSFLSREESWWIHVHCNRGEKTKKSALALQFGEKQIKHWNKLIEMASFAPKRPHFVNIKWEHMVCQGDAAPGIRVFCEIQDSECPALRVTSHRPREAFRRDKKKLALQ